MQRVLVRLPPRSLILIALLSATLALAVTLMVCRGLTFPPAEALEPALVVIGLAALAWHYRRRKIRQFVLPLTWLAAMVWFSTAYTPLMYAVASFGRPWADSQLAQADASLGASAADTIAWLRAWPWAESWFWLAYFSAIPQTALLIAWFGLADQRDPLEKFCVRFMLAALACLVVFALAPAQGTCAFFGFEVPAHYEPILKHLQGLRDGSRTLFRWRDAEGLITCPSFHTSWAILLALAFWRSPWLRWPMLLLNSAMIAATVPVGMHYFVDVLAGAAVAIGAVALDGMAAAWLGAVTGTAVAATAIDHPAGLAEQRDPARQMAC